MQLQFKAWDVEPSYLCSKVPLSLRVGVSSLVSSFLCLYHSLDHTGLDGADPDSGRKATVRHQFSTTGPVLSGTFVSLWILLFSMRPE